MDDEPFEDPRLTAVGLFIEAYGGLIAELSAVHAAHGLAGTDFDTLLRLARSPERRLRMSDLAAQTALSTSGITRIVDRLERQKLVRREPSTVDRRGCSAVLTEDGYERLAADLPALLDTIQHRLVDPLTPDQLNGLTDALRTLRDAVRPAAAARAPEQASA
ncbi:MAG: MarR family transcriptional regulator [Acidimicrobiia bacterium]|nr:MarR family transcriptional regulator [Acidimicrobiia bacterium]